MNGKQWIGGEWVKGEGNALISTNPVTGDTVWQGNVATTQEVDMALEKARNAFGDWMLMSVEARASFIERFVDILKNKQHEFSNQIAEETGKPYWESKTEVSAMLGKFAVSLQAYHERTPEKHQTSNEVRHVLRHRPHGVVVVLGPFNFPGHLPNGHIIPALLAGNTIVYKPSEMTPGVGELMCKLWEEAGLPRGVLNLVQGDYVTGQALVEHPDVDGIFFTGSSSTGLKIQQTLNTYPHRIIALEMGGNNPLVVHNVADIDAACYHAIQSAYITAGQRCTCARRIILPKTKSNQDFVKRLMELIVQIQVGPNTAQPEPFMSSLISRQAAERVIDSQQALLENGAKALVQAAFYDEHSGIVRPGLLDVTHVQSQSDVEIFGPLPQLCWVEDFESAIQEANRTSYGLAAGLLCDDEQLYIQFLKQVRAGLINWNRPTTGASGALPFGGIGQSGNHRPSAYYAADYCAYPVASAESVTLTLPSTCSPGLPF